MGGVYPFKRIQCIQLNFYSNLDNPFEFYKEKKSHQNSQNKQQLEKLSEIFVETLKAELGLVDTSTFQWKIQTIDKNYHERYSILYRNDVGYLENGDQVRILSRKQFKRKWEEVMEKNIEKWQREIKQYEQKQKRMQQADPIKEGQNNQRSNEHKNEEKENQALKKYEKNKKRKSEVESCFIFDFVCYFSLVKLINKDVQLTQKQTDLKNYGLQYKNKLHQFHSKYKYCSKQKVKKLYYYMDNHEINVAFVQQISSKDIILLKDSFKNSQYQFSVNQEDQVLIIYNFGKTSFIPKQYSYAEWINTGKNQKLKKIFKRQRVQAQICEYGPLLLISAHFSSKQNLSIKQAQKLLSAVEEYLERDGNQGKVFILGTNSNFFIQQQQYSIFPNQEKEHFTSNKRRSRLQAQFEKADIPDDSVKDQILSNKKIWNGKVGGVEPQKEGFFQKCLPNSDHPFPNYIVFAEIEL